VKVGPYEVVSELGRGGMGVVYRARSVSGDDVAVKILHENDETALARFERERRILGLFTSRDGFVPLMDAGMSEKGPYLVMPFVPGGTLRRRLEKGPLPIDEALALARALAQALAGAHARGIIHRDLKPENVLFAADGKPLIADLGLAKHFLRSAEDKSFSLSETGEVLGTAGYMAPEQAGDAVHAGPEADVFALGAILHECLVGRRAFEGTDNFERLARAAQGMARPIRELLPEVPVHVAKAIERALFVDPTRRFRDAAQFHDALAKPRSRWPLVAGAGVVLVAALAFVFFPRRLPEPPPDPGALAGKLVAEAEARLKARDFAGAIAAATSAIVLDPTLATAWDARAVARGDRLDWDGALADTSRAVDLDPKLAAAWAHRGWVHAERDEWAACIADSTRAIGLDPKLAAAWGNRGWAHGQLQEWDAAVTDLSRAVELEPTKARSWENLATAHGGRGEWDAMIEGASKAIALDAKRAWAWHLRARARSEKGELDRALEDWTHAIELDPKLAGAYADRGALRARRGDRDGAIADLERYLELAPEDHDAPAIRAELERVRATRR
jgi:tetratricopeptide (TPR) repeat protein/tRNA A-37 threonylcarbamoyl transferase component Bud32